MVITYIEQLGQSVVTFLGVHSPLLSEKIESLVWKELEKVKQYGVTDAELKRVINSQFNR